MEKHIFMEEKRDRDNPVWEVYNLLRTARLNKKYYTHKLKNVEDLNILIQIIIAAAVSTSAIATLPVWDSENGLIVWRIFTTIATIVSFIYPFMRLSNKIKKIDSILIGYTMLENDLMELRSEIATTKKFTKSHKSDYKKAFNRKKKLSIDERGIRVVEKLIIKLQKEVNRELPSKSFYLPKEG